MQIFSRTFTNSLLAGVCTLGLIGCGPAAPTGDIIETVPAAGVLTYQGQPLAHHRVTFFPEGNRPASGTSDETGKFVLGTNGLDDGAVVGSHRVSVTYVGPPNTDPGAGINDFAPPPAPEVKIPETYQKPETSELVVEIPESGNTELKIDMQ